MIISPFISIIFFVQAYRTVCSADVTKITKKGEMNEFVACPASPLPGKDRCISHLKDASSQPIERLDYGIMTRSKRRELGLAIDLLSTNFGCRKSKDVAVRSERSKTAGMLYCYR